jgi:hypothetical protein
MDAIKNQPAWDEALERVLAFLEALGPWSAEYRTRVALRIVKQARQRQGDNPEEEPVRLVMTEAFAELEKWFGEVLASSPDQSLPAGMLALEISEAGQRWPDAVLDGEIPAGLSESLGRISIRSGPDLALHRMISREMDYGAMETIAHETWHKFAWAPILRAAAVWTVIFFVALYAYGHFFPQS